MRRHFVYPYRGGGEGRGWEGAGAREACHLQAKHYLRAGSSGKALPVRATLGSGLNWALEPPARCAVGVGAFRSAACPSYSPDNLQMGSRCTVTLGKYFYIWFQLPYGCMEDDKIGKKGSETLDLLHYTTLNPSYWAANGPLLVPAAGLTGFSKLEVQWSTRGWTDHQLCLHSFTGRLIVFTSLVS